jgi:hypothetical protein
MTKIQNAVSADTQRPTVGVDGMLLPNVLVSDIRILGLGFVSDFVLRISDLVVTSRAR